MSTTHASVAASAGHGRTRGPSWMPGGATVVLLIVALVGVVAAALPSTGGATNVILNQGDVVLVHGSNLLCRFKSDELKLVCMLTNGNGPLPHSWGTVLKGDGTVEVVRFGGNGEGTRKRFRRPLGVARRGRMYRLKVGDRFRAGSTRMACTVKPGNLSFGRSPMADCVYIAPKSKRTTHEFVINKFFAGVFSVQLTIDQQQVLYVKDVKTLYTKKQPAI